MLRELNIGRQPGSTLNISLTFFGPNPQLELGDAGHVGQTGVTIQDLVDEGGRSTGTRVVIKIPVKMA